MLGHVFQLGVQIVDSLVHSIPPTGCRQAPFTWEAKWEILQTSTTTHTHTVNIPLVKSHSEFYGQVINCQN